MNNLLRKKTSELTKRKKKGFTLVELVIVIAIIAILAAMAIPRLGSMRTTAKVSNDVAAAKNIATIASTMVANGILTAGSNVDVSAAAATDPNAQTIRNQLSGKVATDGKAEAAQNAFNVAIGSDGNVSVTVTGSGKAKVPHELYPDNDGSGRTDYANDIG